MVFSNAMINQKPKINQFTHTNPHWKMPTESVAFMDQLRDQAVKDTVEESQAPFTNLNFDDPENSLNKSLYHLQSLVYNSGPNNLISNCFEGLVRI